MLTRAKSLGIIKDIFLTNVNQMVAPARNLLICFTGIDGSGKTALAKNLVCTLNSEGFKFKYAYNRVDPIFCRLVLRIIN